MTEQVEQVEQVTIKGSPFAEYLEGAFKRAVAGVNYRIIVAMAEYCEEYDVTSTEVLTIEFSRSDDIIDVSSLWFTETDDRWHDEQSFSTSGVQIEVSSMRIVKDSVTRSDIEASCFFRNMNENARENEIRVTLYERVCGEYELTECVDITPTGEKTQVDMGVDGK